MDRQDRPSRRQDLSELLGEAVRDVKDTLIPESVKGRIQEIGSTAVNMYRSIRGTAEELRFRTIVERVPETAFIIGSAATGFVSAVRRDGFRNGPLGVRKLVDPNDITFLERARAQGVTFEDGNEGGEYIH